MTLIFFFKSAEIQRELVNFTYLDVSESDSEDEERKQYGLHIDLDDLSGIFNYNINLNSSSLTISFIFICMSTYSTFGRNKLVEQIVEYKYFWSKY